MDYFYGPSPPELAIRIGELEEEIAELRAVLAPLLDGPHWYTDPSRPIDREGRIIGNFRVMCAFCRCRPHESHKPDCAYLRRDALLGRAQPTRGQRT